MSEEYMSALKVRTESFAHLQRAASFIICEPDVSRLATFFNAPSALIAEFSNGFLGCSSSLVHLMKNLCTHILRWYMQTPEHPTKYRIVRWLGKNCFPYQGIKTKVHPDVELFLHPRDWIEYWLLSKH